MTIGKQMTRLKVGGKESSNARRTSRHEEQLLTRSIPWASTR
jgi:hypothetical protein